MVDHPIFISLHLTIIMHVLVLLLPKENLGVLGIFNLNERPAMDLPSCQITPNVYTLQYALIILSRIYVKHTFCGRNNDVLKYLNDFLRLVDLANE